MERMAGRRKEEGGKVEYKIEIKNKFGGHPKHAEAHIIILMQ